MLAPMELAPSVLPQRIPSVKRSELLSGPAQGRSERTCVHTNTAKNIRDEGKGLCKWSIKRMWTHSQDNSVFQSCREEWYIKNVWSFKWNIYKYSMQNSLRRVRNQRDAFTWYNGLGQHAPARVVHECDPKCCEGLNVACSWCRSKDVAPACDNKRNAL